MSKQIMVLDPVRDNVVNRLAKGGSFRGDWDCQGGLLCDGVLTGSPLVVREGPLILTQTGRLMGRVVVNGDVFVFGQAGQPDDLLTAPQLDLVCHGTLYVAEGAVVYGTVAYGKIAIYDGGELSASVKPIREAA